MKAIATILLAAVPLAGAPSSAQQAPAPPPTAPRSDILEKAVNAPGIGWEIYGQNQSARQVPAEGVPGGQAVRVAVTRAGAHAWDVGGGYPSIKPVAAGETLLVAVYLRAPDAGEGQTVPVPIGATEADAPYTQIAGETVTVGRTWKMYFASGTSPKALPAGKARIALQLAGAKQVLELGPAFLLDFGPNYDRTKLPHN